RGAMKLARAIDRGEIDLVQSFLYRANVLARLAARLSRRRPVVVSGQRSLTPLTGRAAALASRWTSRLSDRIVAVSAAVRDAIVPVEPVPPERVVVIQNGVDTDRYRVSDRAAARLRLGIDAGATVVSWAGRLSPEKGVRFLLDGIALARDRGCGLHLL